MVVLCASGLPFFAEHPNQYADECHPEDSINAANEPSVPGHIREKTVHSFRGLFEFGGKSTLFRLTALSYF